MDTLFLRDATPDSTLTALPDGTALQAALPDTAEWLSLPDPADVLLSTDPVDLLFDVTSRDLGGSTGSDGGTWKVLFTNGGDVALRFDGVIVTGRV